jgi:hypothetical protein
MDKFDIYYDESKDRKILEKLNKSKLLEIAVARGKIYNLMASELDKKDLPFSELEGEE